MAKTTKPETDSRILVVDLQIPYTEIQHLLDLIFIHEDYKKERNKTCLNCISLENYLVKGMKSALHMQHQNLSREQLISRWIKGSGEDKE